MTKRKIGADRKMTYKLNLKLYRPYATRYSKFTLGRERLDAVVFSFLITVIG